MLKDKLLQDLEEHFETLGQVRNLAQNYDEKLFDYLLEESKYKEEFKSRFFIFSKKTLVFKLNDFLNFLDLRSLGGSFTSYANKIGLANKTKSLLKTNNEVVLNFAFKDGVIKGGQSKDEQKTQEIFFNEILARDEIDVLFDKKALQNFELIGESKNLQEYLKDNPNLLIKGNNLLALHSLKKLYANKVKLIYIDPPYNTGNDSFNYNDKFNHSTWLTFMKNRLEIAREFLRDDGAIFVQCDDNEQAYLKVLMDEIFGRENFVGTIITKSTPNARDYGHFGKTHEIIHVYAKNIYLIKTNKIKIKDKDFSFVDKIGKFNIHPLYNSNIAFNKDNRPNLYYPFYINTNKIVDNNFFEISLEYNKNFIEIYPPKSLKDNIQFVWRWGIEKSKENLNTNIVGYKTKDGFRIIQKMRGNEQIARSIWDETEFSNRRGTEDMQKLFSKKIFSYPKSEFLLQRIIEIATNENDIVMDFFAGSGTTLAVAHKMKRKWIGIEQMDYIKDITKERLKKVVEGEQGGISKAVQWQSGGSFVYAELMPLNAIYKEKINNAKNNNELEKFYDELKTKAFLDYRVDIQDILKDKDFKELSLEDKKQILNLALDSNMDYVLYGDIKDKDYDISKETIKLNEIFYGDENV
ncbi:site-specific DNA-methyltransferase [Campylobacter jejuni]|uniref:site-specific DNA-methyltransferase n=2 Tax=Campylobacter jejuni TaxID=197 RepID=UPI0008736FDD|nr:site-specific DNA-methyltransferase [Campylobacter jejuni]EEU7336378.1 site-specific DNA-methyltransferase [Campylobacter jejuni]EJF4579582.1 site-specific DNA-methyltransferase [Campylobacter jejuni]OEX70968.1 restriction endonuclease subunit M [Campylobacter jejuni]OEX72025.1 restriction endonuclease subunit M [Campylobacter jejuni]